MSPQDFPLDVNRKTLLAVLLATLVALAGCAGTATPAPSSGDGTGDGADGGDGTADSTDGSDDGTSDSGTGTVQFYVSDRPATIDEFEHLNVTITRIGFQRAGNTAEQGDGTESAETGTDDAEATAETESGNATETETAAGDGSDSGPPEDAGPPDERGGKKGGDGATRDDGGDGDDSKGAGWVTVDVDSRTVDLTRLQGDNATLVGTPKIPAGKYTKVFVYVESIDATLQNGESVNVKLPSRKLQLNKGFTLEPNGTVEFVYDIAVVKAGKSGKYILKPVISQSGTEQDIDRVGEDDEREDGKDDKKEEDEKREDDGEETETAEQPEATDTEEQETDTATATPTATATSS